MCFKDSTYNVFHSNLIIQLLIIYCSDGDPFICVVLCLVPALLYCALYLFSFFIHLAEKGRIASLQVYLFSFGVCFVYVLEWIPYGDMGCSMICDFSIFWSYSIIFVLLKLQYTR